MSARSLTLKRKMDAFYASIRAQSLLVAIEWAGSASTLGELVGYKRHTGQAWARRGRISVEGAVRLTKLSGFPLTLDEMCPGRRTAPIICQHCQHKIGLVGKHTGCLPSFNGKSKRIRQARRKQAAYAASQAANSA